MVSLQSGIIRLKDDALATCLYPWSNCVTMHKSKACNSKVNKGCSCNKKCYNFIVFIYKVFIHITSFFVTALYSASSELTSGAAKGLATFFLAVLALFNT